MSARERLPSRRPSRTQIRSSQARELLSGLTSMFRKILIANRGEIAVRIIRACRELRILPVAVFSEVDAAALHVRLADEADCIGRALSPQSYLTIKSLISAAKQSGAEAIRPGHDFQAE